MLSALSPCNCLRAKPMLPQYNASRICIQILIKHQDTNSPSEVIDSSFILIPLLSHLLFCLLQSGTHKHTWKIVRPWATPLVLNHRLSWLCYKSSGLFSKGPSLSLILCEKYTTNSNSYLVPVKNKISLGRKSFKTLFDSRNYSFIVLEYMHRKRHKGCSLIQQEMY